MASINQACGRMVARRTGTRRTPVSARMLAASAALLEGRIIIRPYAQPPRPAGSPDAPPVPPARGGSGGWAASERAYERLPQAADEMQTPSKELLPFGSAASVGRATGRLPTVPGARPAVNKRRRGKAIDEEPVACGDAPPTFAGIQVIPSAS